MEAKIIVLIILTPILAGSQPCDSKFATTAADYSVLGLKLDDDTILDVQNRFGAARRFKTRDEEEADQMVCYVSAGRQNNAVLMFGTGSQGGWQALTSYKVALRSEVAKPRLKDCLVTANFPKTLPGYREIHLGTSQAKEL